jgi:hypothetical protein
MRLFSVAWQVLLPTCGHRRVRAGSHSPGSTSGVRTKSRRFYGRRRTPIAIAFRPTTSPPTTLCPVRMDNVVV